MVNLQPAPDITPVSAEPAVGNTAAHRHVLRPSSSATPPDIPTWLAEHERTLQRLRSRVTELEREVEREQDLGVPIGIAIAAVTILPLLACLPWLYGAQNTITGWTLLLASTESPIPVSAIYAVAAAFLAQGAALAVRNWATALTATVISGLACITLASFIVSTARNTDYDPASGPLVCVAVLLSGCAVWATITGILRN